MKKRLFNAQFFNLGPAATLLFVVLSLILTSTAAWAQQMDTWNESARTVRYTSQHLRDPFHNPFADSGTAISGVDQRDWSRLNVQGIVWGSQAPQAIINDTVVKVGDVIEGIKILDIRKEGVFVIYRGGEYILKPTTAAKQ